MAPTPKNTLSVVDNRTGQSFIVPISDDNSIDASAFKAMQAPARPGERAENDNSQGLRVFDPAFMNTAVLRSTITYIDGEAGILRYRGYPIEQIAEKSDFLETAYLLLYGELPTKEQYDYFSGEILHHSAVHKDLDSILGSFRYDAHPMATLTSAFAALGAFAPEANPSLAGQTLYTAASKDPRALALMDKQIFRLIGKAINLAAMSYRVRQGRPFNQPPIGLSYAETFLYLLDHLAEEDYKPNPVFARALDKLFILHADHEMNCSTASVIQVGSSLVDPYSAVAAGCAALYGPLHGGANEAVLRMLEKIGPVENVPAFLEKVKKREAVLSGFGHRVYRTTDPRSHLIRKIADEVFAVTGSDPLLETALALRDAALKDEYFIKRRLAPNVDFFSGLIYRAMGFPTDMFPVLFAVPRVVGWLSHWRQMMLQPSGVKIFRPRQLYVGSGERPYVAIESRKDASGSDPKKRPSKVPHFSSKRAFLADFKGKETRKAKL